MPPGLSPIETVFPAAPSAHPELVEGWPAAIPSHPAFPAALSILQPVQDERNRNFYRPSRAPYRPSRVSGNPKGRGRRLSLFGGRTILLPQSQAISQIGDAGRVTKRRKGAIMAGNKGGGPNDYYHH